PGVRAAGAGFPDRSSGRNSRSSAKPWRDLHPAGPALSEHHRLELLPGTTGWKRGHRLVGRHLRDTLANLGAVTVGDVVEQQAEYFHPVAASEAGADHGFRIQLVGDAQAR